MKIKGQAYLLSVSDFKSKNDDGSYTPKFKYVFLVGNQDKPGDFVFDAHVETYISDHVLLKENKFMRLIEVEVALRPFMQKAGDKYVETMKASYVVCDEVK